MSPAAPGVVGKPEPAVVAFSNMLAELGLFPGALAAPACLSALAAAVPNLPWAAVASILTTLPQSLPDLAVDLFSTLLARWASMAPSAMVPPIPESVSLPLLHAALKMGGKLSLVGRRALWALHPSALEEQLQSFVLELGSDKAKTFSELAAQASQVQLPLGVLARLLAEQPLWLHHWLILAVTADASVSTSSSFESRSRALGARRLTRILMSLTETAVSSCAASAIEMYGGRRRVRIFVQNYS